MQRRTFLGGPVAIVAGLSSLRDAIAQQPTKLPVVGYLIPTAPLIAAVATAFPQGLSDAGYVEGQNVAIEYRWADGDYDRLPSLAASLVGRKVDVIAAVGGGFGAGGEKRDLDNPDRLHGRRRSGGGRPGRQSGPA